MRIDYQNAILLLLCLVLMLSVFSVSALAADILPFVPVTSNTGADVAGNGIYIALWSNTGTQVYCGAQNSGVYVGIVSGSLYFISVSPSDLYIYDVTTSGNVNNPRVRSLSLTTISGNQVYLYGYGVGTSYSDTIPVFSTQALLYEAFLNSPSEPEPATQALQYSLPPGNAIYIQVPQGASYTLKTRMPESVLGSNHYPGNNQAITLVQSLPSGGSAPTSPLIPWQQDGALSVLGLSRNASYQGTNASAGYLCIVNPLYYSGTANGPYEFLSNGSIDISIDMQSGFVVYPLDSSLGFTSGLGINVDTSILDTPYTGEVDLETGEIIWQDSSGGSTAPTTGGGNLVSTSETIFDFLRNIADEISTFLKGPIQAIQTVVAAIRQFLSSFTQLYMWLPAPVYNLITSALMIALTIGVIKIFV